MDIMDAITTASELVPSARREGDAVVAAVRGEIDLSNSAELRTELLDLIQKAKPARLVLNLAQVPYMDSSAVAVLVESLQKMRKTGGKVILTTLQPRVRSLLEIAHLNSIFVLVRDEQEAMAT